MEGTLGRSGYGAFAGWVVLRVQWLVVVTGCCTTTE